MLAAATRIFARRGYQDASMDEIAAACGITKPMLYSYFDSKEGLFLACLDKGDERLRAAVRDAVEGATGAEQRLWRGLVALFRFFEDDRDMWALGYRAGPGAPSFAAAAARSSGSSFPTERPSAPRSIPPGRLSFCLSARRRRTATTSPSNGRRTRDGAYPPASSTPSIGGSGSSRGKHRSTGGVCSSAGRAFPISPAGRSTRAWRGFYAFTLTRACSHGGRTRRSSAGSGQSDTRRL